MKNGDVVSNKHYIFDISIVQVSSIGIPNEDLCSVRLINQYNPLCYGFMTQTVYKNDLYEIDEVINSISTLEDVHKYQLSNKLNMKQFTTLDKSLAKYKAMIGNNKS